MNEARFQLRKQAVATSGRVYISDAQFDAATVPGAEIEATAEITCLILCGRRMYRHTACATMTATRKPRFAMPDDCQITNLWAVSQKIDKAFKRYIRALAD